MLGPNGAGKTTSISLMLGLRQPTGGQVRLFGLSPTDRRARSRAGVMLQESGTTGVLTGRELVSLFGTYYPSPMPTDRAVAMAGLADKADTRVVTLSGGQRQRLYFTLAICGDPEIPIRTVSTEVQRRSAARPTGCSRRDTPSPRLRKGLPKYAAWACSLCRPRA